MTKSEVFKLKGKKKLHLFTKYLVEQNKLYINYAFFIPLNTYFTICIQRIRKVELKI